MTAVPAITLPEPRAGASSIRLTELKNVAFIDALQRRHARPVGWFPNKQIDGNIAKERILIAHKNGTRLLDAA